MIENEPSAPTINNCDGGSAKKPALKEPTITPKEKHA